MNNKLPLIPLLSLSLLASCSDSGKETPQENNPEATWTLVWSDEFNDESINFNKWNLENNCAGGGNNEQQCYTKRNDNAFIKQDSDGNSFLRIKAIQEAISGPSMHDSAPDYDPLDKSKLLPFSSARLSTKNKGDWTYGRFEIRAKLPHGQGTWPAIWMLPTDNVYGTWAASGEIDIMEAVNLKTRSDEPSANPAQLEARVYGTLHYGQQWPSNVHSGQSHYIAGGHSPADDFHTYAIEWEQDEIRWYVDNEHFATQRSSGWYTQYKDENGEWQTGNDDAPFNERFHLILNLAIGGDWPSNVNDKGIDENLSSATFDIDYVRVYQCSQQPSNGQGCATLSPEATIVEGNLPPDIVNDLGQGEEFSIFDESVTKGLAINSYNPDDTISYQVISDPVQGEALEVIKTSAVGNLYFTPALPLDLSHWHDKGQIVFDLNILSKGDDADLLIKLDSGWPAVSDINLPETELNQWKEHRINIAELMAQDNRYAVGNKADLNNITNVLVIEPSNSMHIKIANIRFETSE